MKNFNAFTLAEVLITLGIIGVISALIIPVLIQKQNDIAIITALKKSYSAISQALISAQEEYGEISTWTPGNPKILDLLSTQIKMINKCDHKSGCWNSETYNLSGAKVNLYPTCIGTTQYAFTFADGINVCIDGFGLGQSMYDIYGVKQSNVSSFYGFYIDVNGYKKPNKIGKDIFAFVFEYSQRGLIPAGLDQMNHCNKTDSYTLSGNSCTAKVLSENAINY